MQNEKQAIDEEKANIAQALEEKEAKLQQEQVEKLKLEEML